MFKWVSTRFSSYNGLSVKILLLLNGSFFRAQSCIYNKYTEYWIATLISVHVYLTMVSQVQLVKNTLLCSVMFFISCKKHSCHHETCCIFFKVSESILNILVNIIHRTNTSYTQWTEERLGYDDHFWENVNSAGDKRL